MKDWKPRTSPETAQRLGERIRLQKTDAAKISGLRPFWPSSRVLRIVRYLDERRSRRG